MSVNRDDVYDAMKRVYDPEIGLNVVDLGLIYDVDIERNHNVVIQMTLTTPECPLGTALPDAVERVVAAVDGVNACSVDLTFDPPWTPDRINPEARARIES